jgi:hypothetical protein
MGRKAQIKKAELFYLLRSSSIIRQIVMLSKNAKGFNVDTRNLSFGPLNPEKAHTECIFL